MKIFLLCKISVKLHLEYCITSENFNDKGEKISNTNITNIEMTGLSTVASIVKRCFNQFFQNKEYEIRFHTLDLTTDISAAFK